VPRTSQTRPAKKQKGLLHYQLHALIQHAWQKKVITQESLAKAIGYSRENAGQYLRGAKAGTLDLDQAAAALAHIGSSLQDFLNDLPPRERTPTERLAHALSTRPELQALVEDLLPVPKTKLADVIELTRRLSQISTSRRAQETPESSRARRQEPRTKSGSTRRRSAQARKTRNE
jgi:transcriptional regulator with XRE-family HTH domain